MAGTFLLNLVTGLPVWTPVFGWMAYLVGGLSVCRIIHPYFGVAFALSSLAMLVQWWHDMKMTKEEQGWVGPKLLEYLRDAVNHDKIGKYNGGQKVYFYSSKLGALGLLVSGVVLWFPSSFPQWLRAVAIVLHNVTFILLMVSLVFHVYLATVAEPGTFNAMMRGTVSKAWARIHHLKWYRVEDFGLEPERFRLEWISSSEAQKFSDTVTEMTEALRALGPSPYSTRA